MIKIVKGNDRYHFESDWLSTYWHFSFDHYFDPKNMNFGPLRVFNDDVIKPASGFPMHAHHEMEIITYVLEGELEHQDSLGNRGQILPGEVQKMSAGTGIRHSEYNPSDTQPLHLLQMWILPKTPGRPPSWEQKRFSHADRIGRLLPAVSGQNLPGALSLDQDATMYISSLRSEDTLAHTLGNGRCAYLFVIDGGIELNDQRLERTDVAQVTDETQLQFTTTSGAEMLLLDLP